MRNCPFVLKSDPVDLLDRAAFPWRYAYVSKLTIPGYEFHTHLDLPPSPPGYGCDIKENVDGFISHPGCETIRAWLWDDDLRTEITRFFSLALSLTVDEGKHIPWIISTLSKKEFYNETSFS